MVSARAIVVSAVAALGVLGLGWQAGTANGRAVAPGQQASGGVGTSETAPTPGQRNSSTGGTGGSSVSDSGDQNADEETSDQQATDEEADDTEGQARHRGPRGHGPWDEDGPGGGAGEGPSGSSGSSGSRGSSGSSGTDAGSGSGSSESSGSTSGSTGLTVPANASGTFTGTTETHRYGSVRVTVTLANGTITKLSETVQSDGDHHSERINADAVPTLKQAILAANGKDVSAISGATYTTDAYLQSLQSALDQAK